MLVPVCSFMLGQSLFCLRPVSLSYTVIVAIVFAIFCIRVKFHQATFFMLAGGLSSIPLYMPRDIKENVNANALIKIESDIRHYRNEESSFIARVINIKGLPTTKSISLGSLLQCRSVYLPWKNTAKAKKGLVFAAAVKVLPLKGLEDPFSYNTGLWRKGINAKCKIDFLSKPLNKSDSMVQIIREQVIQRVVNSMGNNELSGLLLAMTLGIKDRISSKTTHAFRVTGLSHLLVVSGYHVSIIALLFMWALKLTIKNLFKTSHFWVWRTLSPLLLLMVFLYVVSTGSSSAVSRAGVAFSLVFIAHWLERGSSYFNSLLFALLIVCLFWPGAIFEPGPQYTFIALFAIGLAICGKINKLLLIKIPLFATLATSLVTLGWTGKFYPLAFLCNLFLAPVFAFVVCKLGIAAIIFSFVSQFASDYFFACLKESMNILISIIIYISNWSSIVWSPGYLSSSLVLGTVLLIFTKLSYSRFKVYLLKENLVPRELLRYEL